ncbi:uncharacterized protein LOC112056124 isoform X2 [Bicyclus anynana]|uniref:Uncharacterized protein LOC112056124 isoform X2 n=1 Tax=Bicyclus anynana TaxID=110368 RepID=A0ABM3LSU9_BICAN|nr:uncharacterized protein LOC112056124 isoform X2 [Bicyclus anynana]
MTMKLLWSCVAAVLLTITSAAVDVEKTVQQVQSILKANTLLPRLTRAEIIDLLNDIRDEDAKTKSTNKQKLVGLQTLVTKQTPVGVTASIIQPNETENEITTSTKPSEIDISVNGKNGFNEVESTTKSSGATLTVVLPYTPRDGSSLQELYTRPPRLQVVPEKVTPKPVKPSKSGTKVDQTLKNHGKVTNKEKFDLPAELQAFLDSHGLKGKPGQDNFLLPLDGFKPLPPARIVDGNVQLPENLLLTYDLISPSDLTTSSTKDQQFAQTNFLYDPLRPEIPFELDTSSSESKHSVLPLDLPKPRKTKAIPEPPKPNYEPIDYDSVKVIPLPKGPNPVEDEVNLNADFDQNKRQTNDTSAPGSIASESLVNTESSDTDVDTKDSGAVVSDVAASDTDAGASIADLEDSFGGAVPAEPGDSELPPPRKNGFYWMVDWNSFLEVGDGDTKVNIRFEPKLGDPQMFLPVNVP